MFRASQLWSKKGAKAFVYSFEHTSPRAAQAGRSFLGGLPLMKAAVDAPATLSERGRQAAKHCHQFAIEARLSRESLDLKIC